MRRELAHGWIYLTLLGLAAPAALPAGEMPFASQHTISTSAENTHWLVTADLDGDGDPDLLSASEDDDKIAWYENRLDEASNDFRPQEVITTSALQPQAIAVADLDRDGDPDLLSVSNADDTVAWYENLGSDDGTGSCAPTATAACFGPQQVISNTADNAQGVFAADLDGDGDLEVLSSSVNDQTVAWYENRLDEVTADFGPEQPLPSVPFGSSELITADLDGDGDQDVAVEATSDIAWWENRLDEASADFAAQPLLTAPSVSGIDAADIDGDGDLDLLSSHAGAEKKVAWYENRLDEMTADFGSQRVIAASLGQVQQIRAIDLDQDGDADAVTADSSDDDIIWYENRLNEATADFVSRLIDDFVDGARTVATADFDGDGDRDVVSATGNLASDRVFWHQNLTIHRSADYPSKTNLNTSADFVDKLAVGDVDRDGDLDVFAAQFSDDRIVVFKNNANASSWTAVDLTTSANGAVAVAVADLDRDGDLDALSASFNDDDISWYPNLDGAGGSWSRLFVDTTADGANDVAAADFDGDGDLDVAAASTNDDEVTWYENRLDEPTADFGPATTITNLADGPRSIAAADLDGDGDPDLLSASQVDHKIAWYENFDGVFQPQQIVITTSAMSAQSVFAADVDGDGDVDALSASSSDDKVAWYANDGSGDFGAPAVITSTLDGANEVTAADLDADGDIDVLAAGASADSFVWYENTDGAGTSWTTHVVSTTSDGAAHLIAADLNRDGKLDLVGASGIDNTIAWFADQGGQFATTAIDTAQKTVANGQLEDMLAVEVSHQGRSGDTGVELTGLEIQLTDGTGLALASAQANGLFQALRIYRDNGDGVFEESLDGLILTLSSFALDFDGKQLIEFTDNDPDAVVPYGSPVTYFITLEMTANAQSQTPNAFQLRHTGAGDTADDEEEDIPLSFEQGAEVGTGEVSTQLSSLTCQAPFDLHLHDQTISTTVVCEAGTVIGTGPSVDVLGSGELTLRAGESVEMADDTSVQTNGTLSLEIDPALLP